MILHAMKLQTTRCHPQARQGQHGLQWPWNSGSLAWRVPRRAYSHLCLFRGRLLFLMSRDLMCSASSSSCFMHQCRRMLVVNWSSGWQGRLSTIFTISSLGLGV